MGRDAAAAGLLEQGLRNHRAQRFGQHRANHVLLGRRKHIDHAIDRLGGGTGVQGAEHQMPGFGGRQRQTDRLQIAHFADQDDIRILTQCRAQCFIEAERIAMHLPLVDQALLGLVHEFDRILDCEDVPVVVFVDVVDDRRQRGRLAGAGRSGDQHHATRELGDVLEDRRTFEIFQRHDLAGNRAKHRAGAARLGEGIDAETRKPRNLEREVGLEELVVVLALLVVHDVVDHAVHLLVLHRRQVDALDVAVDTNHRLDPGRQMQIGCALLDGKGQELRDIHEHSPV